MKPNFRATETGSSVVVIPDIEVKQELGLATKGPPTAEVKKLIEVVTKYAAAPR